MNGMIYWLCTFLSPHLGSSGTHWRVQAVIRVAQVLPNHKHVMNMVLYCDGMVFYAVSVVGPLLKRIVYGLISSGFTVLVSAVNASVGLLFLVLTIHVVRLRCLCCGCCCC